LTLYYKYVKIKKMKIEREGRKAQREGRKPQREGRKPKREGRVLRLRSGGLVAMRRIGKDKSKMKFSDRYPKLQLRIGDGMLFKLAKEIDKSGMNTSEILTKALSEYFERSRVAN